MGKKEIKIVTTLIVTYVVLTILSNITSLRIVQIFKLSMDAGTLLYPFTFTLRDLIHKKAGKDIAIYTVIFAAGLNLLMFVVFFLVSKLPADVTVGPQTTFGEVLLPGMRIVLGSLIAMVIAELTDTKIYSAVSRRLGESHQWLRVLISNSISIPLDTVIMISIAFYGQVPNAVLFGMVASNILVKYAVTAVSLNSIYLVKENKELIKSS